MAEIKPFKALRFTSAAGKKGDVCCPPYDIISEEEKKKYYEKPNNVIRLELPKSYEDAKNTLDGWLENGILATDSEDTLYVYEEAFESGGKKYSFKGLVARVKLCEFSEGVILPHENTLSKAKRDRFDLMTATGCNFSQIYSLYRDSKGKTPKTLEAFTNGAPCDEFCDGDGVTHRLWRITDNEKINLLCEQFKGRKLYIADGHHRYETALNYKKSVDGKGSSDYVMMFLLDMENDGLVVYPTHRVIHSLENFDTDKLLGKCTENFSVVKLKDKSEIAPLMKKAYENEQKAFGFYNGKDAYLLTLCRDIENNPYIEGASQALQGLDVSVLHTLILENALGIDKENMAKQINLSYTRSEDEAYSLAEGEADCCFILNATRVSEIAAVAAAGEKMPQKSTYFYPKLTTGLVMNKIL